MTSTILVSFLYLPKSDHFLRLTDEYFCYVSFIEYFTIYFSSAVRKAKKGCLHHLRKAVEGELKKSANKLLERLRRPGRHCHPSRIGTSVRGRTSCLWRTPQPTCGGVGDTPKGPSSLSNRASSSKRRTTTTEPPVLLSFPCRLTCRSRMTSWRQRTETRAGEATADVGLSLRVSSVDRFYMVPSSSSLTLCLRRREDGNLGTPTWWNESPSRVYLQGFHRFFSSQENLLNFVLFWDWWTDTDRRVGIGMDTRRSLWHSFPTQIETLSEHRDLTDRRETPHSGTPGHWTCGGTGVQREE